MSDEWKIVQGLKRENQNNSFGRNRYIETGKTIEYKPRKLTEKELRDKEWKELDSDIIFTPFSKESPDYDPNLENYNIKQIRSFIKECQEQGKPLSMRVGELKIDISDTNPKQVTFTSNGRLSSGELVTHNNFPYSLTIRGNEIFSQVNLIDDEKHATYMSIGKKYIPVKINQQIDIINAEDVTERFIIKPKQQEYDISEDMSEYVSQNSEFQVENHNELVREVSNHSEKIKRLYYTYDETKEYASSKLKGFPIYPNDMEGFSTGFYETYGDLVNYNLKYGKKIINENLTTYEDAIVIAKRIEDHCKYIYSLIMEATKGTLEQSKSNESKTSNQDIIPNNTAESQESPTTNYDTDVESLSEEDLDALIEKMENLQREKQSKIERLQKIKKAQDLIALSKDQDKIITELENQIGIEGVDFGEQ